MAIISENSKPKYRRYGRTQLRYTMTYVIITLAALVILNLYCSAACERLFCQGKENAMLEKAQLAAAEISNLEVLSPAGAAEVIEQLSSLKTSHLVVTDQAGTVIYDSGDSSAVGSQFSYPMVTQAMEGNDVFQWSYRYSNGVMHSEAATPVASYGIVVGCVYMMESDAEQGALYKSLQQTILTITIVLELVLILFSIIFTRTFSKRLKKITNSMRIIQEGDYTHKVTIGGHDELTFLGDEVNDLTERLEISENKRRQFVSDASHELKTPLASIKLLADSILQNDMDIDTIREFVSDIGDEAERLNRMSQKMLDLTRGEVPAEEDPGEIIYMAPTVERVVKMLRSQAEENNIQIVTDLTNDIPVLIREDDLYQITFNLAENGIKYNTPGGTLTISLSRGEDCGILKVTDTGTGIPEDALAHIFERFYRADKARSRKSGGSGLGLSIVRNMVQRNQGEIRVESTFGMGSTFTVEFPAFETEEDQA